MKKYLNNIYLLGYFLVIISIFFLILTSFYQPLIGDDYKHVFDVSLHNQSFFDYLSYAYLNHNGRIFQTIYEFYI